MPAMRSRTSRVPVLAGLLVPWPLPSTRRCRNGFISFDDDLFIADNARSAGD